MLQILLKEQPEWTRQTLVTLDPELQSLWAQRESLAVTDGILRRNYFRPDGTIQYQQVVVPWTLRDVYMRHAHDSLTAGHMAVQKTQERVSQTAYLKSWHSDADLYVRLCQKCCQYRRGPSFRQGHLQMALGCAPMQKVHIDLTGPHTRSSQQKVYLLTAVCSFTKYLIIVPLRDKSALAVAKALVERVYLVYGPMELLVHDGGGEFCNELQAELTRLMGTQVSTITPYRPGSNGVIERTHSTINSIFAKTVSSHQRDWCLRAPFVAYAYNTAYHSSTTYSPFFLMFGRHPTTSLHWMCDPSSPAAPVETDQFVQQVAERMRQAYAVVRHQLRVNFDRAKARYDHRVKERQFAVGDLVWYMSPRRRVGVGRKWQLATTGPYRIMRSLNLVNFVIQRTPSSKAFIVHIDRMTLFAGEPPKCWRSWTATDSATATTAAESAETPVRAAAVPGTAAAADAPTAAVTAAVGESSVTATAAGGESAVAPTAVGIGTEASVTGPSLPGSVIFSVSV